MAACALRRGVNWSSYAYRQLTLLSSCSFSSEAATKPDERLPRFRTRENDPVYHSEIHVAKYYAIPSDLKSKLFLSGGIPRSLDMQMQTFNEACLMVRKPFLELKSYLESMNFSLPAIRFVLYGKTGYGKTTSLAHLVHYAYNKKFLLLHVPWVSNWTKRPKEILPSVWKPERIDLNVEAVLWLQHFKTQNVDILKELNLETTKSYSWSNREVLEVGEPIINIIEHGIARIPHASNCVAALLREIKHHSQFGRFKSLVVIDGVNAFYSKTNVKRSDKTLADARDITIVRAFEKLLNNDWNNAAIVVSVDAIPFSREASLTGPYTPHALLGKDGFELLDPFVPICIEKYTEKEMESVLDYYEERMWVQSEEARTEQGRKQLKFLSGNNPQELMKLCDSL